jgi:hypothetical protein
MNISNWFVKNGDIFQEKSPCLYRRRIEESRGLKVYEPP